MVRNRSNISIVGGETALGRELRERLASTRFGRNIQLIGAEDEITGILTQQEGEPVVMTPLDADRLRASDLIFCAGSPESTRKAFGLLSGAGRPPMIDLTYALEDQPAARLRAPMLEPENFQVSEDALHVIAHPAAIAAALVLGRIQRKHPIRHTVLQILEPASERGQAGMSELQQQSTGLLSFQPLKKAVFDAQLGFNVLPRYGEDAPERLQDVESRIDRHLASLLASRAVPMPSLRLAQAPVFHGYSLSFWIDFESRPTSTDIAEMIASAQVEVRAPDLEPPSNVGVVGQEGIIAGLIEPDRNCASATWIWVVADNYRLLVDNAIAAAGAVVPEERV